MIFDGSFVHHWPCGDLPSAPLIYRCSFNKLHFNEDSYHRYGIVMPQSLRRACRKRKAEYLAGRYAASKVLEQLGHDGYNLLAGPDRVPQWPCGIQASISHTSSTAICAASTGDGQTRSLGVDVERYIPADLQRSTSDFISLPTERTLLMDLGVPPSIALTLIFSAKESLFKAIYPLSRSFFDFKAAEVVDINPATKIFSIKLVRNVGESFLEGWTAMGSYMEGKDEITTIIGV